MPEWIIYILVAIAIRILEAIALKTKNKVDDAIVAFLKAINPFKISNFKNLLNKKQ